MRVSRKREEIKEIARLNKPHDGDKKAKFTDKNNIIELHNVAKAYVSEDLATEVLSNINLEIKAGEFVVILGPSGGGKTTLMNIISGLDRATKGDVYVVDSNLINLTDDDLVYFRRENISYVFQQYGLLPNLTVEENVEIGDFLRKANIRKQKREKLINKEQQKYQISHPEINIDEILELLELSDQRKKFPSQLSGGQQQRVSIARAVIKNSAILFADEPTGAVDTEMSDKILEIFKLLNDKYKKTIVIVTHNPEIANLATKVINIKNGTIHSVEIRKTIKPDNLETCDNQQL